MPEESPDVLFLVSPRRSKTRLQISALCSYTLLTPKYCTDLLIYRTVGYSPKTIALRVISFSTAQVNSSSQQSTSLALKDLTVLASSITSNPEGP